jgi:hypothetical protein
MNAHLQALASRANDCSTLRGDLDLIMPEAFEKNLPIEKLLELLNGTAALYELRFDALFGAYSQAIAAHSFFHYEIEESIMQWWLACDELRCAAEGVQHGLLGADGIANALLGIQALSVVRAANFQRVFERAKAGSAAPNEQTGAAAESE